MRGKKKEGEGVKQREHAAVSLLSWWAEGKKRGRALVNASGKGTNLVAVSSHPWEYVEERKGGVVAEGGGGGEGEEGRRTGQILV